MRYSTTALFGLVAIQQAAACNDKEKCPPVCIFPTPSYSRVSLQLLQWNNVETKPAGPDYCSLCPFADTNGDGVLDFGEWQAGSKSQQKFSIEGCDVTTDDGSDEKRSFIPRGLSWKRWGHGSSGSGAQDSTGAGAHVNTGAGVPNFQSKDKKKGGATEANAQAAAGHGVQQQQSEHATGSAGTKIVRHSLSFFKSKLTANLGWKMRPW